MNSTGVTKPALTELGLEHTHPGSQAHTVTAGFRYSLPCPKEGKLQGRWQPGPDPGAQRRWESRGRPEGLRGAQAAAQGLEGMGHCLGAVLSSVFQRQGPETRMRKC